MGHQRTRRAGKGAAPAAPERPPTCTQPSFACVHIADVLLCRLVVAVTPYVPPCGCDSSARGGACCEGRHGGVRGRESHGPWRPQGAVWGLHDDHRPLTLW